jgi:glycosyltransferase involved in cell wall biosynthesis
MRVLFVHMFSHGQFQPIARYLSAKKGYECTFASEGTVSLPKGVKKIRYRLDGRPSKRSYELSRAFDEGARRAAGVFKALKPRRVRLRPDLIVGFSGLGSTLFLPELFPQTPVINYFEYYARPHNSLLDFRPEWPPSEADLMHARTRMAMRLLELENCTAAYTPTQFQKSLFPRPFHPKIRVIHDGIDTNFWSPLPIRERRLGNLRFEKDARIVTYVARGLESARGFDIFLKVAKWMYEADPRVVFLVVGADHVFYGPDLLHIRGDSFFWHTWDQDDYDASRFRFVGQVSREALVRVFSLSDLHFYLTAPCNAGWSLLNAMSCECTVLGSNTGPVREIIRSGHNGHLEDFFDVEGLARSALRLLNNQAESRRLGRAARQTVVNTYSFPAILPRLTAFYEEIARGTRAP